MVKEMKDSNNDEMREEYDFSGGVRGKHYKAYREGHTVRIHKEDGSISVHYLSQEDGAIMLVWGMYGREPNYIMEWRLYSQASFGQEADPNIEKQWLLIETGGFPNAEVTVIRRDVSARRFRIGAASIDQQRGILVNWIGMTAFEAYIDRESPAPT